VHNGEVIIERHAILGAGCIVLPNVTIGESAAVGAMSLIKGNIPASAIAVGIPANVFGKRQEGHLLLAEAYRSDYP